MSGVCNALNVSAWRSDSDSIVVGRDDSNDIADPQCSFGGNRPEALHSGPASIKARCRGRTGPGHHRPRCDRQGPDLHLLNNTYCAGGRSRTFPESCVLPAGKTYHLAAITRNGGGPFTLMVDSPASVAPTPAPARTTSLPQQAVPGVGKRAPPAVNSSVPPAPLVPATGAAVP